MFIRRSLWRALVFCTAVALLTATNVETAGAQAAPAQGGNQAAGAENRLAVAALAITEAPTIDGLLNEPAWQQAPVMNGFTQAEPLEGQPASQDTEVRILYDNEAIYVGVTLHDTDMIYGVYRERMIEAQQKHLGQFKKSMAGE